MKSPEDKFVSIYEKYADAIFRHCYFRVSNKGLAENLMQETFMRAWKYLSQGKDIENMKALLYKMANNLIIDYYRKKKEASLENLTEAGLQIADDSEKKMSMDLEVGQLMDRLDELEDGDKELIIMRFIDDMRPKEIAKALDLNANVVSVRIHRAIKRLKQLYEN